MSHPRRDILFNSFLSSFWSCCHDSPTLRSLSALLLALHRSAARSFSGSCVRMSSLSADGQTSSVSKSTIAAEVHQTLDVKRDVPSEIAFDSVLIRDELTNAHDLLVCQLVRSLDRVNLCFSTDLPRSGPADTVNVGQCDPDLLPSWKVYTCNSCHRSTPDAVCVADFRRSLESRRGA